MDLITICNNCGARNYFTRKNCGNCGTKLVRYYSPDYYKPPFDLIAYVRGLSTTKLLIGVLVIVIIVILAVVIWQFSPKPDTTPPQIYNVTVDYKTATSARIMWYTNEPSSSQVIYGKTTSYGMVSPILNDPKVDKSAGVTTHIVILKPLSPDTVYHFRAVSRDVNGNEAKSNDMSFRTAETLPFNIPD